MNQLPSAGYGTLLVLVLLIASSIWLGTKAQRVVKKGEFLKGYFLGNRGLGAWALALTASVQSGGTFMGFPSLVYTHGWIVGLWIAGYMVVPITTFGIVGKRLAQLSRRTGALTVPDLFRSRFNSPALGLVALVFVLIFMSSMMIAQFKAGALIMKIAWPNSGVLALSEEAGSLQLDSKAFEHLRSHGVPGDVMEAVRPLKDQSFAHPNELKSALVSRLSAEDAQKYQAKFLQVAEPVDWLYLGGLVIFGLTVVGYTVIGGFLAAVWTDLFQSVMMLFGVVLLLVLAIPAAGGMVHATQVAVEQTGPGFALGPGFSPDGRAFLPFGLAFSFFFVWVFVGFGSPASIVRVMASKSTAQIRKSIFLLGGYNMLIYIPLVLICICGRAIIPGLPPGQTDEIIPRLTLSLTNGLPGGSLLAGLVLAAPFGAVMATVSGYLVVIASGVVRDIYQRFLRPHASAYEERRLTYIVMISIGLLAFALNIYPVAYLQTFVIFSGSGCATTFVVPTLMAAYWPRATSQGAIAAMATGGLTLIAFYVVGIFLPDPMIGQIGSVRPAFLLGLEPIIWGLAASLIAGIGVSLLTPAPAPELVERMFGLEKLPAEA